MAKTWIINVQINTQFVEGLKGMGTWKRPIKARVNRSNNVRMAAVSDDLADGIVTGTVDNLTLNVRKGDTIKWIVSEVNSNYLNYRSVVMYDFCKGGKWGPNGGRSASITSNVARVGFTVIHNCFNAENEPQDKYLEYSSSQILIPEITVRKKVSKSKYHIRLLLVNIGDSQKPIVMKYLEVTPSISFCLSEGTKKTGTRENGDSPGK